VVSISAIALHAYSLGQPSFSSFIAAFSVVLTAKRSFIALRCSLNASLRVVLPPDMIISGYFLRKSLFHSPFHRKLDHVAAVIVFDEAVFHPVFVDEAGDFDIVGAVLGDFSERLVFLGFLVFLPPTDRIQAVR